MNDFNDYAKAAIERCKLKSFYGLAKELEMSHAALHRLKTGKSLPSCNTMIKLSKLAGIPEEKALVDLSSWANADKPEVQKIWLRVSKMIGCFFAFLVFNCFFSTSCFSIENTSDILSSNFYENIYYATKIFIKKLLNTLLKYVKKFEFGGAYV